MKTISFKNENGNIIVVPGEETPMAPAQQVTVRHVSPLNPGWVRNVQLTNEFVLIKKHGCPPTGIHVDDLIALANAVQPKLSWPPVFSSQPRLADGVLSVELVSELPDLKLQWQTSSDGATWNNIQSADKLSCSTTVAGLYRCIAENGAGQTISEPISFKAI